MAIITTTIRIDEEVRAYARLRARKTGFTFMAYYEDLILKDLRDNEPELFEMYKKGHPAGSMGTIIKKRSSIANYFDPDGKIIPIEKTNSDSKVPPGSEDLGQIIQEDGSDKEAF